MYLHFFGRFTMHHLTRWKANILTQAWETHPINEAFFHPLLSIAVVTAYQREQLAQNTNCQLAGRQTGPVYSPFPFITFTQCSRSRKGDQVEILGHRNVLYSAICRSNCRPSGIFDTFCIETQQLRLAWHAMGVFKGGVVAKRVSENNLLLRATHTHTHL